MEYVTVQSRRIEYVRLQAETPRSGAPVIVMLHEGLGSIAMWRDFPQKTADATGCEVVVYSRYGYGGSALFAEPCTTDFMHKEALGALPEFLDQLQISRPILFGHSDGGSIALIYAGCAKRSLSGVIAMAPHVMVENITVTSIAAARDAFGSGTLRNSLARYHDNVDTTFRCWSDIWLHPAFLRWNIEQYLPTIACPVLAIQGIDDEYGTMEQIEIIGSAVKDSKLLKIPACRHSPHRDQPQVVLAAVSGFVEKTTRVQVGKG